MAGKTDPLDDLEAGLKLALRATRRLRRAAEGPKTKMAPPAAAPALAPVRAPKATKPRPRRPKRPAQPGAMKNLRKAQKRLEELGVKPYRPRAQPDATGRSTSAGSVRPRRQ